MPQKLRVGKLDFNDIKDSLKTYLSQQTEFTDYNFEGSNISQLLNILAYNAHYDALAANFLANEVFLDTATKRSSVVSRAKELGYTSRSRRSSNTVVSIKIRNVANEAEISSIALPRGSRFSTKVNDELFTFTTRETVILDKTIELGAAVFVGNVTIYEGILTQHTTSYDGTDNTITIPNVDIDTSTLKVELYEDSQWVEYSLPQSFLSVNATSRVYMVQEGFSGFEIYFGDGILGLKPAANTPVRMTYVVTSGPQANGALSFSLSSSIAGQLSNTIVTVTPFMVSAGGMLEESVESVKLNARNSYGTQNRAVTSDDFAALAQQNFASVKEVEGWSGSDNIPPRFGKTILCVVPATGDVLQPNEKVIIADFLQRKSVGNVKVEFVDPEYVNVELVSNVKFNPINLKVGSYELEYIVRAAITEYASTAIQRFKGSVRYSQLLSAIDASDYAITGNETVLKLNKELKPNLFSANNFRFSFSNTLQRGSLTTTKFFDGELASPLYLQDVNGALHAYYSVNGRDALYKTNIGTVDYVTGEIVINNLTIATLQGLKFKISATPTNLDIYSSNNIILKLTQENIKVNIIKDTNV